MTKFEGWVPTKEGEYKIAVSGSEAAELSGIPLS